MSKPMKNIKLTTCQVVVTRGLKQRLRTLVKNSQSPANGADLVVGQCEDCGSLIYADDILNQEPESTPAPVDEWEYLL